MKITIDMDVLKRHGFTWPEFQGLLAAYAGYPLDREQKSLEEKGLVQRDLFRSFPPVLPDNTKDLVAAILMESDEKAKASGIDFDGLARKLIDIYPKGNKPGTTYSFGGTPKEIAQKLRVLVVRYNFMFTEEEAIEATKEYVGQFKEYKHMHLLRNFLLKTLRDEYGHIEIDSMFMTIIENHRAERNYDQGI